MRILVLRHHKGDSLGRLQPFLDAHGAEVIPVDVPDITAFPSQSGFDAMIVLGGIMQVWDVDRYPWLAPEIAFIERSIRQFDKPYLGICLGHQLLAVALGGRCGKSRTPEIGLSGIGGTNLLLDSESTGFSAFQWHSAEVVEVPKGLCIGGSNAACRVQSMHGPNAVHSVQFHPEVDLSILKGWFEWTIDEVYRGETRDKDLKDALVDEMNANDAALERVAREIAENWLRDAVRVSEAETGFRD